MKTLLDTAKAFLDGMSPEQALAWTAA
jgi:hypothetical protein